MKSLNLVLLGLLALLAVSCKQQTPEEKAKALIEADLKTSLIKPESYSFAKMQMDSCFLDERGTNYESMVFGIDVSKKYKEYSEHKREAESAETTMAIYAPTGYSTTFGQHEYKKAKEKFDKESKIMDRIKNEILDIFREHKEMLAPSTAPKHELCGYRVIFGYRAKTAADVESMGESLYYLDKDLTKIIGVFDESDMSDVTSSVFDEISDEFYDDIKQVLSE